MSGCCGSCTGKGGSCSSSGTAWCVGFGCEYQFQGLGKNDVGNTLTCPACGEAQRVTHDGTGYGLQSVEAERRSGGFTWL